MEAQATFSEVGDELPPREAIRVVLSEARIASQKVHRGRTRVERHVAEQMRFLQLAGDGFTWRVPEEGYEGAWWEEAGRSLRVSSGVGAFVIAAEASLPEPPYEYELARVQPDGSQLAPVRHVHKRPLVVGERFVAADGPWLVETIDDDSIPALARVRRPFAQ